MIDFLVKHFVNNWDNVTDTKVRQSYGTLGGCVGIACNVFLFLIKLFAGLATGSISIMADAFNNLSDAGSCIVTVIGFWMAGKPADPAHPFGHGRIEYLSGLFVSVAVLMMGVELFRSSVEKIIHPEKIEFRIISVVILVVAILVKFWMAYFNHKLGKKIDSEAMKATSTDSLSDCIATSVVLAGLILYRLFSWNVDGYMGVLVAIFVLYAGYESAKETIQPLLGSLPDKKLVSDIHDTVMDNEVILGIHDMIIHDYGPGRRIISLHAEVPYNMDILEAHDYIDSIENELKEKFQCDATIHMDPVITDDKELSNAREMVEHLVLAKNKDWKIHDLRMVRGKTHTNLIFDLVVPAQELNHKEEIRGTIQKAVHDLDKKYYAVVTVEQSYT